ncbi:MAG: hypothetical protein JO098_06520, partial [Candidatus Eremiobacteraeota bacterium]|nr:hypothetical protein [Candidatus Eremiobacteraeota bacterium]
MKTRLPSEYLECNVVLTTRRLGITTGAPMDAAAVAATKPSKQKILVIEDDTNIARVLQLELEHEGFAVEVCGDGASAIE